MLRDGLMLLPDCFTANDINAVIDYLCCDCSLMREIVDFYYFLLIYSIFYFCILRLQLNNK